MGSFDCSYVVFKIKWLNINVLYSTIVMVYFKINKNTGRIKVIPYIAKLGIEEYIKVDIGE